jgi:hypothetical protein
MEEFRLTPTKNTPEIILKPEGSILFRGRSIHENASVFYAPVESWISQYILSPAPVTSVDMVLEYFNSASAKVFISILQKITLVTLKHRKFVINWYYEDGDEDILERGEYFSSVLNIPFNFIEIYDPIMSEHSTHKMAVSF